jgi:hypothetical protein
MQSSYHNLPDINGVAQKNGLEYRSENEFYNEETGELRAELKAAYLPEADVLSYVRSAVLKDGEVVIKDSLTLGEEHEVVFHLMTHVEPKAVSDGVMSLAEGRTLTYDKRLKAEVEEFEVADGGMEKNWGRKTLYRINFTASFKKDEFIFTVK